MKEKKWKDSEKFIPGYSDKKSLSRMLCVVWSELSTEMLKSWLAKNAQVPQTIVTSKIEDPASNPTPVSRNSWASSSLLNNPDAEYSQIRKQNHSQQNLSHRNVNLLYFDMYQCIDISYMNLHLRLHKIQHYSYKIFLTNDSWAKWRCDHYTEKYKGFWKGTNDLEGISPKNTRAEYLENLFTSTSYVRFCMEQ